MPASMSRLTLTAVFAFAAGCAGGVGEGSGTGGKGVTGGTGGTFVGGSGGTQPGTGGHIPAGGGTGGEGATTGGTSTGGAAASDGSGGGSVPQGGSSQGGSTATGGAPPVSGGGTVIVNDTFWKDTTGQNIYSQGGGVLRVGDTYYWYGYRYGNAATYATGMQTPIAGAVTTYSSTDLVNWKPESVSMMANAGGWFGRLGVVYHAATKKYVLAAQGGGGLYFATADAPGGPFVYNNVQATPPGIANGRTGDQTMFQDDDGAAYVCRIQQQRPRKSISFAAACF